MKALLLLILLLLAAPASAQQGTDGPHTDSAATHEAPAVPQAPVKSRGTPFGVQAAPQPSFVGGSGWWRTIVDTQRALQKKMTAAMRALTAGDTINAALFLIGMSFLYGIFHAAGPGHGKAVISSYMLANKTTLRRGIAISVLAAMVQACSAVILVGMLVLIMKGTGCKSGRWFTASKW